MIPPLHASKRPWRSGRDDSENKSKRARYIVRSWISPANPRFSAPLRIPLSSGLLLIFSLMSSTTEPESPRSNLKLLNWSAVLFAFLQSVCSAFIALSSIRLFIGATALASALGVVKRADKMHIAAIRIPMMLFALVSSLLNLLVLWQVWRLRSRSASAWRQKPVSPKKRRSEILQLLLSLVTLFLLGAEYWAHWKLFGGR
jgi:hypothetical protein